MLYGSKEITMDEITLITDYVKELVGNDVDVIWGAGKDDALGDELHVAVIATGFNGSPIERKKTNISFKVETVEDLEMQTVDARKLEEEERMRKQKLEEVVGYVNSEVNSGEISGNVNGQSCLTTMMTMNRFGKRRLTGNGSRSMTGSLNRRTDANGERMRCRMWTVGSSVSWGICSTRI